MILDALNNRPSSVLTKNFLVVDIANLWHVNLPPGDGTVAAHFHWLSS